MFVIFEDGSWIIGDRIISGCLPGFPCDDANVGALLILGAIVFVMIATIQALTMIERGEV